MANYEIAHFGKIEPQQCPCGSTRRAFAEPGNAGSMHIVEIKEDARTHYHKKMTEIYLVLEGEGHMELDGQLIPVKPQAAIFIKPGCRHRAVGKLKVLVVPIPAFDETDEWFD
ncbi:MAG: cupin domain-containing protein [Verrucomicrobia bacterium]|nr:cupin domain-containing protein [Verrucomicrobiota bacterium]